MFTLKITSFEGNSTFVETPWFEANEPKGGQTDWGIEKEIQYYGSSGVVRITDCYESVYAMNDHGKTIAHFKGWCSPEAAEPDVSKIKAAEPYNKYK